jgi:asparagine synthase (glutamine-hydrolysing)
MCGIHGCIGVGASPDAAMAMADAATHRGPDALSVFTTSAVALSFNRLSIIGGFAAEQPIYSEDGQIVLIGNGEIFNWRQLSDESQYELRTASDIEILLHIYCDNGLRGLSRLEGQFSFMLYDRAKKVVCIGRDRWGITPLYYVRNDNGLQVSSSLTSLYASGLMAAPRLDPQGIMETWNLYGASAPRTCFAGVCELPPGRFATYDISTGRLDEESYVESTAHQTGHENADLRGLLEQSVRTRLSGFGDTGIYVSGGLDSSIVAAMAAALKPGSTKLFGIQFENEDFNEGPYQQQLADALGMDLQVMRVSNDDIVDNLDNCIRMVEMPLIRSAPVPMMLLSRAVRSQGIKHVLCGEGADELFAGYPVFDRRLSSVADKQAELQNYADCFSQPQLHDAISEQIIASNKDISLADVRRTEIRTKLSRYLLAAQGDRVSMANSVEQRFPFLDNSLNEYAFSCTDDELIQNTQGKQPLRAVGVQLLPVALAQRKKQGYLTPDTMVAQSLIETGKMEAMIGHDICEEAGVFDSRKLRQLIHAGTGNETNARFLLFAYSVHKLFRTMQSVHKESLL